MNQWVEAWYIISSPEMRFFFTKDTEPPVFFILIPYTVRILVPLLPFEVKEQKKNPSFTAKSADWFPFKASQTKLAIMKTLRGTPAARFDNPFEET